MRKLLKRLIIWALGYEPASTNPQIGDCRIINGTEHILSDIKFNGMTINETWIRKIDRVDNPRGWRP